MPVTVFAFLTVVRMVPNRNESQTHKRMTHQLDSRRIPSFLLGSLSVAFLHFAIHLRRPRRRLNRPFSVVNISVLYLKRMRLTAEIGTFPFRSQSSHFDSFAVTLFMVFRVSLLFLTLAVSYAAIVEGFAF